MIRNVDVHIYTLNSEIVKRGLVTCKESLVHKIATVGTVQLNSLIDFKLCNNGLIDSSGLFHYTSTSFFFF